MMIIQWQRSACSNVQPVPKRSNKTAIACGMSSAFTARRRYNASSVTRCTPCPMIWSGMSRLSMGRIWRVTIAILKRQATIKWRLMYGIDTRALFSNAIFVVRRLQCSVRSSNGHAILITWLTILLIREHVALVHAEKSLKCDHCERMFVTPQQVKVIINFW